MPSAAGFLLEAELAALARLVDHPAKPFVCAIGGAKIKDKIGVFDRLSALVDAFCVGGGMANTLLAASGVDVGTSLRDDDLDPARRILTIAKERNVALELPRDAVVAPALDDEAAAHVVPVGDVGGEMILDIGPATAQRVRADHRSREDDRVQRTDGRLRDAPHTAAARRSSATRSPRRRAAGAVSVVGGGDAAAAAHMLGFAVEGDARIDGRRRDARVSRGQDAAGSRRT